MDDYRRCKAKSKRTGERCRRYVVPGYRVCHYHGANPKNLGGCPPEKAKGNTNALKHGAFANRVLDDDEQELFDDIARSIKHDFDINTSSDRITLELLGISCLQALRALNAGDISAARTADTMVRMHMKNLKATKLAREGEGRSKPETTPAEWATALLKKVRQADAEAAARKAKRAARAKAKQEAERAEKQCAQSGSQEAAASGAYAEFQDKTGY